MLSKEPPPARCRRWLYEDIKDARFMRFLLEVRHPNPDIKFTYFEIVFIQDLVGILYIHNNLRCKSLSLSTHRNEICCAFHLLLQLFSICCLCVWVSQDAC